MLRRFLTWAVALSCSAAASADLTITISAGDGWGFNGGEYDLTHTGLGFNPVGLTGSNPFESFCIETDEILAFNTTHYAQLNTGAIEGGAGGGNPDPLDPRTAYLYQLFVTGALPLYDYSLLDGGVARSASADDLQQVMWYIEDENPISWTPGDGSRRDTWYQLAVNNAGPTIGDVRVLNMYLDPQGTQFVQDLLILTPEPTSLCLLVLGGLWAARRR